MYYTPSWFIICVCVGVCVGPEDVTCRTTSVLYQVKKSVETCWALHLSRRTADCFLMRAGWAVHDSIGYERHTESTGWHKACLGT